MKLTSDYGDLHLIRLDFDEEIEDFKKGDFIQYGNSFYKVAYAGEDGFGNGILLVEAPVIVHDYK